MMVRKVFLGWLIIGLLFGLFLGLRFDFLRVQALKGTYSHRSIPNLREIPEPKITAQSYLVMDAQSGMVLLEKNPHLRLNPASITKMATAINALESYPLEEVITVHKEYPVGKNMELQEGEKITVKNLIYGLLVHSANDAAFVLARQGNGQVSHFVDRMNKFVRQLGLEDTHFVNFDGEDDYNHYSTCYDLAHLARFALRNKVFEQSVRKEKMEVTDISGEISHELKTTNELLGKFPEVKGIKTGWTPEAGECFIGLIEVGDKQFITVILGSEDRFGETEKLINWLKRSFVI